jgi:hypothetical protein
MGLDHGRGGGEGTANLHDYLYCYDWALNFLCVHYHFFFVLALLRVSGDLRFVSSLWFSFLRFRERDGNIYFSPALSGYFWCWEGREVGTGKHTAVLGFCLSVFP